MAPEVKREVMLLSIGGADVFIVVKKKHVFVSAMIDSMAWMIALHDT
jgi:hypothetical protein